MLFICNTSKIDFRRLEALFCDVWPSPDFSLLSSRISLQNRKKCRFEPTFKKACPARLSERKSLISSGFRRVRGLQKRPQNGHPRHSCIKDSKSVWDICAYYSISKEYPYSKTCSNLYDGYYSMGYRFFQ